MKNGVMNQEELEAHCGACLECEECEKVLNYLWSVEEERFELQARKDGEVSDWLNRNREFNDLHPPRPVDIDKRYC